MIDIPDRPSGLDIQTADGKDEWRPLQRETIANICEAFRTKGFVLANMPTGSGKTIVATAVQRMLKLSSVVLTHTIHLQTQYQQTVPWATVVTGRRNHKCDLPQPFDEVLMADRAPCVVGDDCEHISPNGCSYYKMLYEAAGNPQTVLNYAYAVRILQSRSLFRIGEDHNPFRRELLVCDEGDLAEGAIVDAARLS